MIASFDRNLPHCTACGWENRLNCPSCRARLQVVEQGGLRDDRVDRPQRAEGHRPSADDHGIVFRQACARLKAKQTSDVAQLRLADDSPVQQP